MAFFGHLANTQSQYREKWLKLKELEEAVEAVVHPVIEQYDYDKTLSDSQYAKGLKTAQTYEDNSFNEILDYLFDLVDECKDEYKNIAIKAPRSDQNRVLWLYQHEFALAEFIEEELGGRNGMDVINEALEDIARDFE